MTAPEFPPLPPADHSFEMGDTFTADQLREYAMLERLAERDRCAMIAKPSSVPAEWMEDEKWLIRLAEMTRIAAAIRSQGDVK